MPETQEAYQIKVSFRGISPMIWRRFLVSSSCKLYTLHQMIQLSLDWTDTYMHRFHVHGRDYDCEQNYAGGTYLSKDMDLQSLKLHPKERFLYSYNFNLPWKFDVRLEKILSEWGNKQLPRCISGKGQSPPEQGYPAEADYGYEYEEDEDVAKAIEAMRLIQQSLLDIDAALKMEDAEAGMALIDKIISNQELLDAKAYLDDKDNELNGPGFSKKDNIKLRQLTQDAAQAIS